MNCKNQSQKFEQSTKRAESKPRFFKSVTFQSWMGFTALVLLIVVIMSIFVLAVVGFGYNFERKNRALDAGRSLILSYPSNPDDAAEMGRYEIRIEEVAKDNELTFVTFKLKDKAVIQDATYEDILAGKILDKGEGGDSRWKTADKRYFSELATCGDKIFSYTVQSSDYDGEVVIMGAKRNIGGEEVCFYVSAMLLDRDFAGDFIIKMWLTITLLVLVVSIVYVHFISRRITGPLVRFHHEVQHSAKTGKMLNVKGNGYTEIDDLAAALNESAKEQAKTEEFRRDLIANVSHDLRTPLTMIKAYSEMIRDLSGNNPKKRNEHCEIIINEVDTLNSLVSDLLDLSKMQAGTLKMDKRSYDLSSVVSDVIGRLGIFQTRDGYCIESNLEENCLVLCDRKRIEQAIYNLICNAINYTGEDKKVEVLLTCQNGNVRFSVRDSGKGIKEEDIERIWDRYYRANQTKRKVAGSGIGLSIVQNVLLNHEAKFGVNSKLGEGTEFWFILPLYQGEEKQEN